MIAPLFRQSAGFPAALVFLAAGIQAQGEEVNARVERIERLLGEVAAQLDSLKREAAADRARLESEARGPIAGELMTDRQKLLARATRTEFRALAAGYSFDGDLPMGMHLLTWRDPWGFKFEGGAIISENVRVAGFGVTGLYSIHRFNALELLETHLYGLAGGGYYWERWENPVDVNKEWYETTDQWARGRIGVGTELSFFNLGGVRMAPEVGLQADRYFSRHEESPSWSMVFGEGPKSDFSLAPFFAFHASFYFR